MQLAADLLDRIAAALAAGSATPTDVLQGLLIAAGGEKCWQRGRLVFRLSTILTAQRPIMATSTTHRFKPAFSGKSFTGFPLVNGSTTKMVTAHNLTDDDVPLLQRNGGAHLLEPITATSEGSDETQPQATAGATFPDEDAFPNRFPAHSSYEKLVDDVYERVLSRLQQVPVADLTAGEVRTTNTGILQTAVEQDGDTTIVKHSSGGPDDLPITAPAAMQAEVVTPNKLPDTQPEPEDLHKLLKPALQARYKEVLSKDAPADMLKEDLIKAIEAGPAKA